MPNTAPAVANAIGSLRLQDDNAPSGKENKAGDHAAEKKEAPKNAPARAPPPKGPPPKGKK